MNPYFSTWLANSMKHEASSSPWKWNDKRTVPFLSDKRFNRFAVPYHSLSHNELDSLLQQLKQTDLLDKSYFYLWDEPTYMKEYHLIGQYSQEIHKLMPEAKVLTTFYCGQRPVVFRIRPLARRHSNFQYERLGFTSERSQRRHMPFSSPRQ